MAGEKLFVVVNMADLPKDIEGKAIKPSDGYPAADRSTFNLVDGTVRLTGLERPRWGRTVNYGG